MAASMGEYSTKNQAGLLGWLAIENLSRYQVRYAMTQHHILQDLGPLRNTAVSRADHDNFKGHNSWQR